MLHKLLSSSGGCSGRDEESKAQQLFHAYLPHICEELQLPGAGSPTASAAAIDVIKRTSQKKGVFGSSARWLCSFDNGEHLRKFRHVRMFIIDSAVLLQNATPFQHRVNFSDTLSDIFAKERDQGLQVASHILRDVQLFKAPKKSLRVSTCS